MLDILSSGLAKIFGTKSDRDIKEVTPYLEATNKEWERIKKLSHDDLRAETQKIRDIIDGRLADIDRQIESLKSRVESDDLELAQKEEIFSEIDDLEVIRNKNLEEVLLDVLPATFAVVRDTARRFKENEKIEVTASAHDKTLAISRSHIQINGEKSVWSNRWIAAGNEVIWDMVHYDVQIAGGVVLHKGKIAEMATGEGKTLVATLPAFLNALSGRGVHIVTVNDYLAKRDSEWMAPIFEFHGMRVDCIDKHEPNSEGRRNAYQADVTYGTNNEFGFDYLRDNMARSTEDLVQRKHHYAMVDEVDSVLIDDARTPLIISGPIGRSDNQLFQDIKPRIAKLVEAQKRITNDFLVSARKEIAAGNEKEGGVSLFRSYRGLPKNKALIKFLSESGIKTLLQKTENTFLEDNQKRMPEADEPLLFTIDEKNNQIELTDRGIELITKDGEDHNFFIMPDIGTEMVKMDGDNSLSDRDKLEKKDQLIKDYTTKSERIHTVNQLLKAYTLYEKDTEYILVDGKVKIVDEQTGRVLEGRRYSDGLHQAIEAKENVKVEDATQTYATVTLQNYFRMYHKLAGMTGTAETEAGEFWQIYKLDVVVIPTNRKITRDDREDFVYKTTREKFNAVVEEINTLTQAGRPVLVGTTSVEISELLSRMLTLRKIKHQVLNAKQHQREAEIVAEAGKPSTVTIATNMAGRGTDIKLTPESKSAGGLAIIGTERHESRRVDRQLRGRAGRQGDPGTSQFFVTLEDSLMRLFGSDRIARMMDRLGLEEGEVIQHSMITKSIERAQRKVEENNFGIRKRLLEYDDVMNSQRELIYKRRRNALFGDRLEVDILNMIFDTCEDVYSKSKSSGDYDGFRLAVLSSLAIDGSISQEEFEKDKPEIVINKLYHQALEYYHRKSKLLTDKIMPFIEDVNRSRGATVQNVVIPLTDGKRQLGVVSDLKKTYESKGKEFIHSFEKSVTLALIDLAWKEHLREMDDLKQSVQNAVYEQKDPLLIYKFEGFNLFKEFVAKLNEDIISFLFRAEIPIEQPDQIREARKERRENYNEKKEESRSVLQGGNPSQQERVVSQQRAPVKSEKIYGRNDRVNVQYMDGSVRKDVKYKSVEEDILNNRCVLIDE